MNKKSLVCLIVAATCTLALAGQAFAAKNIILMIGDGMGYQHVNAGSYYLTGAAGNLSFEQYYKCGVKTYSANSSVTDSAAAATALATGNKVNNGVISQASNGTAYPSILENAKALGKRTGLVTTSTITDATPAGFGAHEADRGYTTNIGNDYLNSSRPDVLYGGGSGGFSSTQINTAQSLGYKMVYNNTQMNGVNPATDNRAFGLFNSSYMGYEYDRQPSNTEPTLTQMTQSALGMMNVDPDGFFIMIEGGNIDHAAHNSDINRTTREVVEFNNSVQYVLNWMQGRNDTLLIVTADHETGGLTATNRGAGQYPGSSWSGGGGHTGANVPFYIYGANSNLVDSYIVGGAINNTDVFRVMNAALIAPVPEPSSLIALLSGLGGVGFVIRRRK